MFERVLNTLLYLMVILIAKFDILCKITSFSEKYKAYNLTVRGMTSAGFGVPAEAKDVFTREESKRNEVCSNSYPLNRFKNATA